MKTKTDSKWKRWLRANPYLPAYLAGGTVLVAFQIASIWDSFHPLFQLNEGALLQTLNTYIQVVVALYGLTLTGYIFFSDRLQASARQDDALDDIVILLQQRYHNMILLITVTTLVAMILNIGLIFYGMQNSFLSNWLWRLLINEALVLDSVAAVEIFYFVISIVDPNKFTRVSEKYKARLSSADGPEGSLQEFMADYEASEKLIRQICSGLTTGQQMNARQMRQFLQTHSNLNRQLVARLNQVGAYRSYVLYSETMTVSQEMCEMAKQVRAELQTVADKITAPQNEAETAAFF